MSKQAERTAEIERETEKERGFARGLCFHKYVWVFVIGSFLGVVIETIFCFVFTGEITSRKGMVYGPFNQIYGFAAVLLLGLVDSLRLGPRNRPLKIFLVSCAAGGTFEFVCSLIQEQVFGSVSWDYSWMNISLLNGRTNVLYIVLFGVLGVLFITFLYPAISRRIELIRYRNGVVVTWILLVGMVFNLTFSAVVVLRWADRRNHLPAENTLERYIDDNFPDDKLKRIYPSIKFVN